MTDITLVTPPDILIRNELSILLVHPSSRVKDELQSIITELDCAVTIYIYDAEELHDADWLLTMFKTADFVVVDCDNSHQHTQPVLSYFISYDKTLWLTTASNPYYNKLSVNRVYNLDILKQKIGGYLEKQQT